MADKRIDELPPSIGLSDDGTFVIYQENKTQRITGRQIKQFTKDDDKVNVSDIVNGLTTNATNKPLSAAQGVVLKNLLDGNTGDISTLKSTVAAIVQAYEETADVVASITPSISGETLIFGRSRDA